jgi:hypothetical protein
MTLPLKKPRQHFSANQKTIKVARARLCTSSRVHSKVCALQSRSPVSYRSDGYRHNQPQTRCPCISPLNAEPLPSFIPSSFLLPPTSLPTFYTLLFIIIANLQLLSLPTRTTFGMRASIIVSLALLGAAGYVSSRCTSSPSSLVNKNSALRIQSSTPRNTLPSRSMHPASTPSLL